MTRSASDFQDIEASRWTERPERFLTDRVDPPQLWGRADRRVVCGLIRRARLVPVRPVRSYRGIHRKSMERTPATSRSGRTRTP